jgi:sugar O-acyltransferase (sialic acid O-acetyltransferase NeuD family)
MADIGDALGYRPVFVTRDAAVIAGWARDDEIIDEGAALEKAAREVFAVGVGDNCARAAIAKRLRATLRFPSLVHPDTSFGRGSRAAIDAATGTVVFAGARFTNNIACGDFCTINLAATLSHDVEIGDFASLSPGASVAGNVRIGEGAWIGVKAAVNQGAEAQKLDIGAWTTIGSGAVVVRDCDAGSVYAGVPARKIK